jgi:hypothetical protein
MFGTWPWIEPPSWSAAAYSDRAPSSELPRRSIGPGEARVRLSALGETPRGEPTASLLADYCLRAIHIFPLGELHLNNDPRVDRMLVLVQNAHLR